ncbi:MAG: transcriptional regulator FilR1 domain-containing protein [Candidatus Bathyarchaeota archaeon]
MSFADNFYDLLFEVSSEDRHKLLLYLNGESANLTNISRNIGLNLPETRRHVTRLIEVDLIERNPNSSYSITNFGKIILEQIDEIAFFTNHKDYFQSHNVDSIPREFKKRLGELSNSEYENNILNYIRKMENVIKEAEEEVWLLVDQFPLNHLSLIIEAIERGVRIKIIEPINRLFNPDLEAMAPEETLALDRMKTTPLLEQKMLEEINVFMCLSEKNCVLDFPTLEGKNDYIGFVSRDEKALKWGRDLFQYYWERSEPRTLITPSLMAERTRPVSAAEKSNQIVVVGRERPEYDAQALQDAVDNYDEVILMGRFNIGTSTITVKRSVHVRGEGRTNDVPDTKVYKKGWNFPFLSQEFLLTVGGDDIDVTIENIHIENFNGTCISNRHGNSVTIRKNRITLESGLGRGLSFGNWGDHVVGITSGGESMDKGSFPGGILIEDNYLDFGVSFARGGFISNKGFENSPDYRPDLQKHEAAVCVGILLNRNLGNVVVRNNVIRNMNSRGILVADNWASSDISIIKNTIISEVFGAYPYNSPMAGVGIFIQNAWTEPRSGGRVEVADNKIVCTKVNYSGIVVHGPAMYQDGAGKLEECIVRDNEIELEDGYIGVQIRKSDSTIVKNNKVSGRVYYGLLISGSKNRGGIDLTSHGNIFKENDLEKLVIKEPDDYSDGNVNGYTFTGEEGKSRPAHVWLTPYASHNVIQLEAGQTIIDEGKNTQTKRL